jgi:beta-galactosidase
MQSLTALHHYYKFCVFVSLIFLYFSAASAQTRKEYLLQTGWKFTKGEHSGAEATDFNDTGWQNVTVPHDWAIYGPFGQDNDRQKVQIVQNGEAEASTKSGRTGGLPFVGVGWYRLTFKVAEFAAGKKATIVFDGAMSRAQVFVNGKAAGEWPYGYNSFHFDITDKLKSGLENVLAVRLENLPESSRWYPGAGLYRNVHLIITDDVHIPVWGTYITTLVIEKDFARVVIKTNVVERQNQYKPLKLVTIIKDKDGKKVAEASADLAETDRLTFDQNLIVRNPQLWSTETPVLYTAESKLYDEERLVDEYKTRFGIRAIAFKAGEGFFLNGKPVKFKGVCNHHDLGPLGAAVNKAALRRQLTLLKDMGCNAIRTSHNMPAPELVDLCDEMGFMMMDESFDEWKSPKVKNGYGKLFDEWAERDMVNMLHRDRNHPSVVMWSIGNEVPDQSTKGGNKIAKFLLDICHREDPTRLVTAGMDRIDAAINNNFASVLDVPGFNYKPARYEEANSKLPQGFILGSETASTVSSRGVYKFPAEQVKQKMYDDNQSSSYDVEACSWSQIPDEEFAMQDDLNFVAGEFVWTGFDYLGEPTPYDSKWPSHSSYFGIIDLAGIPKDRFYLYRSRWNEKPTLHILPHWTWPGREGQVTPVFCYTNFPSAELFVNGKSMGKQSKSNQDNMSRYRLMWKNVKYEPGAIKVVAYDANGKPAAEETVHTAGKPHHIELTADRCTLTADGQDLAFITARVVDAKGNLCPDASNLLGFRVTGEGKFKAIANGDATNLQSFQNPQMNAFSGMLIAIVQSGEKTGEISIEASSKGLKSCVLKVNSEE